MRVFSPLLFSHAFFGLQEEAILRWYDNVQAEDARLLKAKLKVAPLAQWLRADSESSDEE